MKGDAENNDLLSNALGSATAGIISRLLTHPLDTAKARLQAPPSLLTAATNARINSNVPPVNPPHYRGVRDVLLRTYKAEGISSLYRGFGAIVVGGTPGTMTYLCSYEWIKNRLTTKTTTPGHSHDNDATNNDDNSNSALPDFVVHFTAGMLAETIACIIYVPVDVIKERLQVQQKQQTSTPLTKKENNYKHNHYPGYNGSLDALKQILRHEGLGGIYKGYGATLASFGPFSAFYFLFYEQMKSLSREYYYLNDYSCHGMNNGRNNKDRHDQNQHDGGELPFSYVVLCSAGAGATASWITSPLDMAKLRLQIQRAAISSKNNTSNTKYNNHHHKGMVDCLSDIYKQSGIRGLFRGAGARVIHFTPATMITMTCFEQCRSFFQAYI